MGSLFTRKIVQTPVRPVHDHIRPIYMAAVALTRLCGRLLWKLEVVNADRLPRGGYMIAATHTSFIDPPILGSYLGREAYFLSRDGILKVPILGWISQQLNAMAVRRGESDREALKTCKRVLQAGWPLVFFPEGTRSPNGKLGPIQPGFVMIMDGMEGIPYVPVVLQDTHKVLPKGRVIPRRAHVRMIVGEPVMMLPRCEKESLRDYHKRCAERLEKQWRELGAQ